MKCPHCGYVHGHTWIGDDWVRVNGELGEFFRLPIKMEKEETYAVIQRQVFGCPKCNVLFMENN